VGIPLNPRCVISNCIIIYYFPYTTSLLLFTLAVSVSIGGTTPRHINLAYYTTFRTVGHIPLYTFKQQRGLCGSKHEYNILVSDTVELLTL